MADKKPVQLEFVSGAMPDAEIKLVAAKGKETLSQLFSFDLRLESVKGPLKDDEIENMLEAPCAFSFGVDAGEIVHGVVASLQTVDGALQGPAYYMARVVPAMWLLTLPRTNRIFPDMDVKTMVTTILTDYGFKDGKDFHFAAPAGVKREYVAQYEETDWDFIQRWLEHEGLFYWFDHKDGDKLVIGGQNTDATVIEAPSHIAYRLRNNLTTSGESTVWEWSERRVRIPARVAVLDYNYRTPHIPMVAKHDADTQHGFGSVFSYGENFKDVDAGKAIAKLRAERIACTRRTMTAETDCARFRVGHQFELEGHYQNSYDGKYLITSMTHHADLADPYRATFEAIPIAVPYRPPLTTPKPRIHGVLHAHVDADGSGDYAMIDEQGRYRVKMPFDVSGRNGSKASHWIRLAESYAGARYGSHYPLHKGTEVLVAHIDGDPDRPVIVASVPNAHTISPVTKSNATQSVVQTASGMIVEMEDLQS